MLDSKRFWNKVKRVVRRPDLGECWEWQGFVRRNGYGQLAYAGKSRGAHVVAWMLTNKRIVPNGLQVLHDCDNKSCINPDHLHTGTCSQNALEAVERGLWAKHTGTSNPANKYTPEQVERVRGLMASGMMVKDAALASGISRSMASQIKTGRKWAAA